MRLKQDEAGFGLVELLIAMVVLNVGLLAIVAAFSSGAVAINRAGKVATAAALADQQMEQYRAMTYMSIGLDTSNTGTAATDATYTSEPAPSTGPCQTGQTTVCGNVAPDSGYSCSQSNPGTGVVWVRSSWPNACDPIRTISGSSSPDRHNYRIDTYIRQVAATTTQRATKIITVVVRDGSNLNGRALARQASTFDCSTGQIPGTTPC